MNDVLKISEDAIRLFSLPKAIQMNVLPIRIEDGILYVGVVEPFNNNILNDIAFYTGLKINPVAMPLEMIQNYLRTLAGDNEKSGNGADTSQSSQVIDVSIIEYVDQVIREAIRNAASDIHFESFEDFFRVRYRIDGHLREISNISAVKSPQVISRIKIMANLDISERRRPQDGRIKYPMNNSFIDIRVSCLPTGFGEKVVLRLLDRSQVHLEFEALGLRKEQNEILTRYLKYPYGMILVTGPTGSGKTTSLYTALSQIHSIEKNILTIEDPIEFNLPGINQSAVKPDIGYTFANALRTFLRQDPDVIMVGEIRDRETAEIAIRAALTGHLVFSTLHTNDSISAIIRLIDMGIEPFLVASSLKLIIAQRLVRTLCTCKKQNADYDNNANAEGLNAQQFLPAGCNVCKFTGYKGRTALFEFFEIKENIADLITKNASLAQLKRQALENGFKTLKAEGIKKMNAGITTYDEVLRETML